MSAEIYNVLFLCTGNSARSILAEAYLGHRGRGKFRAYSAGSHPVGQVNPLVLELLEKCGISVSGLRSKSWDEFAAPAAPALDFVFTVCDRAAGEICPVWPGQPVTAHWGVADPAAVSGSREQRMHAVDDALRVLERRIDLFMCLPISSLDRMSLRERVQEIGRS
jgi:protein-tyrosine-phosphatase